MAFDELNQAFSQFQAGLNQLQASRVLTQANEAVTQIRNSELDATEKNNQLRVLGQQMAFGLASQGVAPAQIQTLADTFMPAKPTPIQSLEQGLLSDDPDVRAKAEKGFEYKAELESQKRKAEEKFRIEQQARSFKQQADMYGWRSDDTGQDKIRGELNTFRDKVIKDELDGMKKAQAAKELLAIDSNAAMGLVSRLLVGQTGDPRVSDQDAKAISPDPSWITSFRRIVKRAANGEPLEADQKELGLLVQTLEHAQKSAIKRKAAGFAQSRKDVLRGMDENEFYNRIAIDSGFADAYDPNTKIPENRGASESYGDPGAIAVPVVPGATPASPARPASKWLKKRN
jgi:hypothetical protein